MLKKYRVFIIAVILGLLAVLSTRLPQLKRWNLTLSDSLYQHGRSVDRRIVILGIDDESLEYFGPIQTWTRDIYADAISLLCEDEENRPLAIGLDVLFAGESEEEADAYLAETCEQVGSVVVASNVILSSKIVEQEDSTFYLDDYHVERVEEPYPALKEVTRQGFWNNMFDLDGIIRSGILRFDLEDGKVIDSFSYTLYQLYAEKHGLDPDLSDDVPMNSRYQWYLPFQSYPGGYEEYSFASLFTGDLTGADLADCIVLIGPYAEGLGDSFQNAIDHSKRMYGVEIHANMIDAMIDQVFQSRVSRVTQLILLFLVITAAAIFYFHSSISWPVIWLWWFLSGAGYIAGAGVLASAGYLLDLIYIPLYSTILVIVGIGRRYILKAMEKRRVVNTFKRYVAPQVVDEIFKAGEETLGLGGKMTDIACLFVDIRGFTTMSEVLEPPQVVEILNQYLKLTSDCILKNEGTLDKFIGDATMALYNAPLPLEDYIYKAVKTAWDMVAGAEALKDDLRKKYGRTVSFGVGVHCGKAVVGNIGTELRMDYTAIGDTVNTAARLEANAKAGQILISRDIYDALQGRIRAVSLGTQIHLKGKSEELEIFEIQELFD